ncbi:hypothetical protein Z043_121310, partial [Scleropages formosus]
LFANISTEPAAAGGVRAAAPPLPPLPLSPANEVEEAPSKSRGTMAEDDSYLQAHFLDMDTFAPWMGMETMNNFSSVSHATSARIVDGPYLQIVEQPKQRGFRFRYGCEGPSHGGLPGASSERNRRSYPQVKICNYQGPARVVVQLVTSSAEPHFHAHSLVGKQCEKGVCIADLPPKDTSISFPNLGILHVTKKNVSKTLEERMTEAFRMGYNYGVAIHPEIDCLQGEVRIPREFTEQQKSLISSAAVNQAKEMDLSVVRLMFTAFLPDSDGGYSRRLDPVISEPIYDSKAPNASNLKIVRMDRTAGCVTGGEEVYLLCDKVQKDDIQVRFYEEDDTGQVWEAYGDFSPTDVHRQFAIVFKTPKYRNLNLQKPISVFVQLKRKSDNETSEPKPFTYHPQGYGYGTGSYGSGYSFSQGSGGTGMKHASQGPSGDDDGSGPGGDDDSEDDAPGAGGAACLRGPPAADGEERRETETPLAEPERADGPEGDSSMCALQDGLLETARRQAQALFHYAMSGDVRMLLALQRPLMTSQDEDGDTCLHLGVIHSRTTALCGLAQVISALPGEDVVNMRNDLYQTPLHLAVVTQQEEAVTALLEAGADATLADRHGNTALHLAAQQSDGRMAALLLQHPEMVKLIEQPNATGLCPIHLAVQASSLGALRELLSGGAHVEAQELSSGRTALHLATERDDVSLAGCLLLEVQLRRLTCGHTVRLKTATAPCVCVRAQGNAHVDSCTYDGSTPLHVAAGRGSVKLSALLMAAGADPHKENCEPLYDTEEDRCPPGEDEEGEEDEGFIPGTTPLDIAPCTETVWTVARVTTPSLISLCVPQVYDILNGKRYQPSAAVAAVPPQGNRHHARRHVTCSGPAVGRVSPRGFSDAGDMKRLGEDTRRALCHALEQPTSTWEGLAQALGLGVLNSAFRLSASPAHTLLDSYEVRWTPLGRSPSLIRRPTGVYSTYDVMEVSTQRQARQYNSRTTCVAVFRSKVSGGTLKELEEALRLLGSASALDILQGALVEAVPSSGTAEELAAAALDVLDLKDRGAEDGGICDSGVETSYMNVLQNRHIVGITDIRAQEGTPCGSLAPPSVQVPERGDPQRSRHLGRTRRSPGVEARAPALGDHEEAVGVKTPRNVAHVEPQEGGDGRRADSHCERISILLHLSLTGGHPSLTVILGFCSPCASLRELRKRRFAGPRCRPPAASSRWKVSRQVNAVQLPQPPSSSSTCRLYRSWALPPLTGAAAEDAVQMGSKLLQRYTSLGQKAHHHAERKVAAQVRHGVDEQGSLVQESNRQHRGKEVLGKVTDLLQAQEEQQEGEGKNLCEVQGVSVGLQRIGGVGCEEVQRRLQEHLIVAPQVVLPVEKDGHDWKPYSEARRLRGKPFQSQQSVRAGGQERSTLVFLRKTERKRDTRQSQNLNDVSCWVQALEELYECEWRGAEKSVNSAHVGPDDGSEHELTFFTTSPMRFT